jgi:hypothetical protein
MVSNHLSAELAMEHAGQRIASLVREAELDRMARQARAARRGRRRGRRGLISSTRRGRALERLQLRHRDPGVRAVAIGSGCGPGGEVPVRRL